MNIIFYVNSTVNNKYVEKYNKKFEKLNANNDNFKSFLQKKFIKKIDVYIVTNKHREKLLSIISSMLTKLSEENIILFWDFISDNFEKFLKILIRYHEKNFLLSFFQLLKDKNQINNFYKIMPKNDNLTFIKKLESKKKFEFIKQITMFEDNLDNIFDFFTKEQIKSFLDYIVDIKPNSLFSLFLDFWFDKRNKDTMFNSLEKFCKYIYKYNINNDFFSLFNKWDMLGEIKKNYGVLSPSIVGNGEIRENFRNTIIQLSKSDLDHCKKAFNDFVKTSKLKISTIDNWAGGDVGKTIFESLRLNKQQLQEMLELDYLDQEAKSIIQEEINKQ